MQTNKLFSELIEKAIETRLITSDDRAWAINSLLSLFRLNDFTYEPPTAVRPLHKILHDLCELALSLGILKEDTTEHRDLFDTRVMGLLTPRPSTVIARFFALCERSPKEATDDFYALAEASNYIRTDRIQKDMKWRSDSPYGELDITVNLSKPEKDPRAIAAAKLLPQSDYPKCLLCHEQEGHRGNLNQPARENLRQIPLTLAGERWYLQYSPYVYYNEHCIVLSEKHEPMRIGRASFDKALDFVAQLPHYFVGQNADLPIVGGSILSHDHMQGGRYTFPMERAPILTPFVFEGFEEIRGGIVRWPMSVVRLTGEDPDRLATLAERILNAWRTYSDPEADVLAESAGEPHNTVTPIARRRGKAYELDLVLRNNRTTEEHPLGLFHPHAEHHNIKKENIGLIEVMGLAVLPARLKTEMKQLRAAILDGTDVATLPAIAKHAAWLAAFRDRYEFTPENTEAILKQEIGNTFARVLADAGVYKDTPHGRERFLAFLRTVK